MLIFKFDFIKNTFISFAVTNIFAIMCGIYAYIHNQENKISVCDHTYLQKRGPDECKIIETDDYMLAFYRLAVVGVSNGEQPFEFQNIRLMCNGEIYNYQELRKMCDIQCKTDSDCEIIIYLYKKYGIEKTVSLLEGEFAFVLIDMDKNLVHFARDHIGIKPLYMAIDYCVTDDNQTNKISQIELSSVMYSMCLKSIGVHVNPRVIYTYDMVSKTLSEQMYTSFIYTPEHASNELIQTALYRAVCKRIQQTERPIGFLLSGGLDSSIILAIAIQSGLLKHTPEVFTFGFSKDAPDVQSATLMIDWLKNQYGANCLNWHLVIQSVHDGLSNLPNVICALETYDTTTIRASTPMFLLSKYISEHTDVRVILSGEGSDELFGGYMYFKYAPNDLAFRSEIIYLLNNLFYYDALRADRTTATHGLELRPPFLDKVLINTVLHDKRLTKCVVTTKELLREVIRCFKTSIPLLPHEILYGRKEAFSDAVGWQWKDSIEAYATKQLSDVLIYDELVTHKPLYNNSHIIPTTNEMRYYQQIYSNHFSQNFNILHKLWLPNQAWVNTGNEPSARSLAVYSNEIEQKTG